MDITITKDQGRVPVTVFHLSGDLTSDQELLSQANEAYQADTRFILLDLAGVPYMSSSGLRALHQIFDMLRRDTPVQSDRVVTKGITSGTFTSPHLKILNPSNHVMEVLKIAGYDMFLEIHRDYRKAIASF